ncbi:hypothetical protein BKA69DRAFT_1061709, partial [Paraphysoderma sedebokerense]
MLKLTRILFVYFHHPGYLKLLSQLTVVGEVSESQYNGMFVRLINRNTRSGLITTSIN